MTTRRTFLSAGLAAIPVGVGAALGMRHLMASGSTLRLLGRDATMLALFDTGKERVLFLLGDPDIAMLEGLAHLLPIGRRRLDLIVGSHHWLTSRGARDHLDLETIATLSLQSSASAPPVRGNVVPVTSDMQFDLGEKSRVLLSIRSDNDTTGANPGVEVEISCAGTRLVLASGIEELQRIEAAPDLLAVPGEIEPDSIALIRPGILASTSPNGDVDVPAVQVFPDDAVTFTIRNGAVTIREDQFSS